MIKKTTDLKQVIERLQAELVVAKSENNYQKITSLRNMIKCFERLLKKVL